MRLRLVPGLLLLLLVPSFAQQQLTIQDAIVAALQQNYDVRLMQNSAASAYSAERYSVGLFMPLVSVDGTYVKNERNSREITADGSETVRKGVQSTVLDGGARLSWTLFDGTRMFATRKRLDLTANQSSIDVKNQMNNTAAQVINSYYIIVRQKQQLRAIQEQIGVSEERVKLAERRLQVGTGGKPEFLQAKVDLNAFRTAALAQEALIIQLKDQLNALLGLSLTEPFETSDSIEINLGLTIEEIIHDIENTNITLLSARRSVDIADAILWESRAGRSPIINFNAAYTFNRVENTLAANQFGALFQQRMGYNYGLSISVPILNRLNVSNAITQAKLNLDRQKLIYEQQLALATVSARVAFASYDNARKTLLIEEENILLAEENVTIMLESFKRSIATAIELRTAQQSLADATNRLIAARYNAKLAETELLRLKGALVQ